MPPKIDNFIAPPCFDEIKILFQDEHILLIDKPSGLLSLSGKNPLNLDSVHYRLVKDFPTATLVHRLDLGTSGIMVVALSKECNAHISRQFQTSGVSKVYTAIVAGSVADDTGVIDRAIAKDPENFPQMKICEVTGKPSVTQFKVLHRFIDEVGLAATRVQFFPQTGRTHQLRIHSRELGHPILGCDLYGTAQTHARAPRLLLHATHLAFTHPITGARINSECPCPF